MEWSATITGKTLRKGVLHIEIKYTKGETSFTEVNVYGDLNDLHRRTMYRLAQLKQLDETEAAVQLGTFVPVNPEVVERDPKASAYNAVFRAKEELSAGLITQEEYDTVLATYKSLNEK